MRRHMYAASPFWYGGYSGWGDGWGGYPGYGWGGDYRHLRRYYVLDGYGGRVSPHGYSSGGRSAYRTPLFGPRFKERPTVYVTDNGPERPVSELSPEGTRARRGDLAGSADRTNTGSRATRPWAQALPRTARPRGQGDAKVAGGDTRDSEPSPCNTQATRQNQQAIAGAHHAAEGKKATRSRTPRGIVHADAAADRTDSAASTGTHRTDNAASQDTHRTDNADTPGTHRTDNADAPGTHRASGTIAATGAEGALRATQALAAEGTPRTIQALAAEGTPRTALGWLQGPRKAQPAAPAGRLRPPDRL